jgi:hypothetical protein
MMGAAALGRGLSCLWLLLLATESGAMRGGLDRELAVRERESRVLFAYALTLATRP